MQSLLRLAETALEKVSGNISRAQAVDLAYAGHHSSLIARRRATLIISRVRMVASLFAVLTPLWIVVDVLAFEWPLWGILGAGRALASLAFAVLALSFANTDSMHDAYRALGVLLTVPTTFYLFSHPVLGLFEVERMAAVLAAGYAFLPFVMVAGLAVFPITALEGALFSAPLIGAVVLVSLLQFGTMNWTNYVGALWLLALIASVATLAGMSQLHFMMALITQASHDALTRAFTRRCGEELLDVQFRLANRQGSPFSLVFVDIDNFKSINDTYGHEEGDNALRQAAAALLKVLRRGDLLVRWGGEEFLVILPFTDADGAKKAVHRIRNIGLGMRPDGRPLTASMGIAERNADHLPDWPQMVEVADQRMYQAKQRGKNRVIACNGEEIVDQTPIAAE